VKKLLKIIAATMAIVIVGCAALFAFVFYGNWSAERKARAFCDAIPIGSAISAAIATAEKEKVLWGKGRFYTFFFPGSFFDKAVCEVEVDKYGKAVKKGATIEHD
jgi:hypothetical protein